MPVMRFDAGRLDSPSLTSQGYVKAKALATRTGVFYYLNFDGTVRRELRHPDEVFSKESMATLGSVIVTNDHPPEPLNADNTSKYNCGFTSETVEKMDEFLKTGITLTNSTCIKEVLDGVKQELSCGYFCDLDNTPGNYNGEEYDVVQRNIRYNHLAVVKFGRAGPEARIQMDSLPETFRADAAIMTENEKKTSTENKNGVDFKISAEKKEHFMAKFKIDGVEYEVQDGALAQKIVEKTDALESSNKALEEAKKELETLKAKTDALDSELKKSDAKVKELESKTISEKEIRARADEMNKVFDLGKKILDKEFKEDMSVEEVKTAIVKKELSDVDFTGKEKAYFDAAFDVISKRNEKAGTQALSDALKSKTDSNGLTSDAAKKKREEEAKNAWKK